jgi:membrane protein
MAGDEGLSVEGGMIAAMTLHPSRMAFLQQWPLLATLKTLRLRFREDRLGLTAGSLTFTTTIALVPLLTVMLALFSAFPVFARFRKALETQFLPEMMPDFIAKQVIVMLTRFAAKASQLGGLSLIALGLTAMFLMLTIDHTLNAIWRVRRPRPFAQRVLVYWAALTLGPLMLGVSLWVSSYLLSASKGLVEDLPGGVTFLLTSLIFGAQTAGFAALFRFVPNTHVRWEHAWSGAIFVSVGLELSQKGLALYLAKVPVYSTIYGAFATLPIFLVWIYLSWLIVLMGAVVAAYAPSLLSKVKRWPEVPGHRFQLALAVIQTLAQVQHTPQAGQTAAGLAALLRTDPLQVEPILEVLEGLGWAGRLDEAKGEDGGRYVLLCDPTRTPLAPLMTQTLLQPDAWTRGLWQRAGLDQLLLKDALGA